MAKNVRAVKLTR